MADNISDKPAHLPDASTHSAPPGTLSLFDRFQKYIAANSLFAPGERVLLAVSGGVDSMVMLSLFSGDTALVSSSAGKDFSPASSHCLSVHAEVQVNPPSAFPLAVAHCNFQLRGEESDGDERLVVERCRELGVECHVRRFDTAGEVERSGDSVQMVARRLRYEWFGALCREHGYAAVAIAHHADDAVETFFINLLRGTGLRGLTGIHNVGDNVSVGISPAGAMVWAGAGNGSARVEAASGPRLADRSAHPAHAPVSADWGRVVRPLLFASRREIADYATAHGVPFREDSSNRSTKYLRNRVRLELLPLLGEISPGFVATMGDNIRRFDAAQTFIDRSVEILRARAESRREGLGVGFPDSLPAEFRDAPLGSRRAGLPAGLPGGLPAALHDELIVVDPSKIAPGLPLGFVLFELLNPYGFHGDVIEQMGRILHPAVVGRTDAGSGERTGDGRSARQSAARRTLSATCIPGEGTGKRFYSSDHVAYIDRGKIIVDPIAGADDSQAGCWVEIGADDTQVHWGNSTLMLERVAAESIDSLRQPANIALLDADKVRFPLHVRRWRDGDRFIPLGMKGAKKVSDYLIDAKIPLSEKHRQLVLVSGASGSGPSDESADPGPSIDPTGPRPAAGGGGQIAWLVGRRIDDRFRITGTTKNILRITIFAE